MKSDSRTTISENPKAVERKSDFAPDLLEQAGGEEAESIKKGLFLTEEQMQELKVKAREEFEQQIAGWGVR